MILEKFKNIITPTELILKNQNYKNINLINKANYIIQNRKLIHEFDDDIDQLLYNAINYYDNLNAFIVFGKNKVDGYKYFEENFKCDYILYGIKYIKICFKYIYKILYHLLYARIIIKSKKDIENYLEENFKYLTGYEYENIELTILVIRKRNIHKKYLNKDINEENYCVFIPNTKEQIKNTTSIFFNETTIKFLENQNFEYFLSKDYDISKKLFFKYKKWLMYNLNFIEQQQFMLYSSVVLFLLGNRNMNDLDLYIHTVEENILEKIKDFDNKEEYNLDYHAKNTSTWPLHWNTWLDEWAVKCGAKYFEELLGNPKYYFYFLGVKILSIDCDIVRRIERKRPKAYADLIALNKRYHFNIKYEPIPNKYIKYVSLKNITEQDKNNLLKKGGELNEVNNEIILYNDLNLNKFIEVIIKTLLDRYKMKFTENDIKNELSINNRSKNIRLYN